LGRRRVRELWMVMVTKIKKNEKAFGVVRSKIVYMRAVNFGARSF
jgi:hypothetical protein